LSYFVPRLDAWRAARGLDKLLLTGERGALAVILVPTIVLFFVVGLW
jgi:hypothetical protein